MGRNAGWLTAAPDLLPAETRPHLFYLPENPFDIDEFLVDVKKVYDEYGYGIIAISEGINIARDSANARVDGFGHAQLGGAAAFLCNVVEDRLNIPTRAIEFSLLQRAAPNFISKVDTEEAVKTGETAVRAALAGNTGKMVTFKRVSQNPYKIDFELADLSNVANAEACVPAEFMAGKTRMSDKFREYLRPLIQGETEVKFKDGIASVSMWKYERVK